MKVLHQIGDRKHGGNFNSLEEIIAYDGEISFDGVYESVYQNYKALKGKKIIFFFSGKYLGGDNSFDVGQPLSRFCTLAQIAEMAEYLDAEIGYHGWEHRRCTELSDDEIEKELLFSLVPKLTDSQIDILSRRLIKVFAWPYGDVDDRCINAAIDCGYKNAYSVFPKGSGSIYAINRTFLNWDMYDADGNNLGIQP